MSGRVRKPARQILRKAQAGCSQCSSIFQEVNAILLISLLFGDRHMELYKGRTIYDISQLHLSVTFLERQNITKQNYKKKKKRLFALRND
jgi:hypothetical protein